MQSRTHGVRQVEFGNPRFAQGGSQFHDLVEHDHRLQANAHRGRQVERGNSRFANVGRKFDHLVE
jgi:hypothetical protein